MRKKHCIDCIVLAGHGTALGSIVAYLRRFESMDVLWSAPNSLEQCLPDFLETDFDFHTLILDHDGYFEHIELIRKFLAPTLTLIVMTRDPIDQIESVVNTHIFWWALCAFGASEAETLGGLYLYQSGSLVACLKSIIVSGYLWPTTKILPALSNRVSKVYFTDVSDLSPKSARNTLSHISQLIYGRSRAYAFEEPHSRIFCRKNRFIGNIKKLHNKELLSFSLEVCPAEFYSALGKIHTTSLHYNPSDVGFSSGDFKGDLAFECKSDDPVQKQIPPEKFLAIVRRCVEANNKLILRSYCEDISTRIASAESLYSDICFNNDKIFSVFDGDKSLTSFFLAQTEDLGALLTSHGSKIPSAWKTTHVFHDKLKRSTL